MREFAKVYRATPAATIEKAADVEARWSLCGAGVRHRMVDIREPRRDGYE